jgi:Cu/Ag efflux protein CusF
MWKFTRMLLIALITLGMWGCADSKPKEEPKEELKVERSGMLQATATVEAVDMATRMVTLKNPDGSSFEFFAGKEVVNLPQVMVGDKVSVVYSEALAVRMAKPGEVRDETMQGVARALPGEKPGVLDVIETTVTAEIKDIDKTNEKVTLKFPDGKLQVVKVKDPANLEKVVVGDTIVITITKAMAISVQKTK